MNKELIKLIIGLLSSLTTFVLWVGIIVILIMIDIRSMGRCSVTVKDIGISGIEYGQVLAYDRQSPDISDIVFSKDAHFSRVVDIKEFDGFTEYFCKDDYGNECTLNSASDSMIRVLNEDTFDYFIMQNGATLIPLGFVIGLLCLPILWLCVRR